MLIGENLELIQEIASNCDNTDYDETIHAHEGSEEGITTFTDRGVESLKEFLADIRTCEAGARQFLVDEHNATRKRSRALWQTSQNHRRCGLSRMDTSEVAASDVR